MNDGVLVGLSLARKAAESRMLDAIKVTREGERVWDEDNGQWIGGTVTVYEGRARVSKPGSAADAETGSQLVVVSQLEVHVPVDVVLQAGDEIEVTACPTRAEQVGRVFVVAGPFDGSQVSAARYRVEAADGRG